MNKLTVLRWNVGEFLIFKIFKGMRPDWLTKIIEFIFDIDVSFRKNII